VRSKPRNQLAKKRPNAQTALQPPGCSLYKNEAALLVANPAVSARWQNSDRLCRATAAAHRQCLPSMHTSSGSSALEHARSTICKPPLSCGRKHSTFLSDSTGFSWRASVSTLSISERLLPLERWIILEAAHVIRSNCSSCT